MFGQRELQPPLRQRPGEREASECRTAQDKWFHLLSAFVGEKRTFYVGELTA